MPGLVGFYDPDSTPDKLEALLAQMCRVMTHETWYQTHALVQPPLAAARIGLGVFNPQPQPACNEDRTVLVWLDGEIYDFQRRDLARKLREAGHRLESESDAELLAHLYEDLGPAFVRQLDGTFAVALFDMRLNQCLIAVDRSATRPLYFCVHAGRFLFASEIKAIVQDPRLSRRLDEQGLVEFFTFRHPLGERTLLEDVRFLPAGCLAAFCQGCVTVERYWEPVLVADRPPRSDDDYLKETEMRLRLALERQTYDDRPIGEFLSGGLDSRLLAGLIPPRLEGRFHTFSRGPLDSWDVRYGSLVSQHIRSQHHVLELKSNFLPAQARQGVWLTDGLMTVIDTYVLSTIKLVKPHVDVVFFGIGLSSAVLAGVALSSKLVPARSNDEASRVFFARMGASIPQAIQARLFSRPFYERTRGIAFETLRQMVSACQADTPAGRVEAFCIQCRWPRSTRYGPTLARLQVETRYPFSDNDLSEISLRVPARLRLNRRMQIALLQHTRPDLARLPWEYSGLPVNRSTPTRVLLQRGLYYARRQMSRWTRGGVSPGTERERANYPIWFRTTMRPWLEGILLDPRTLDRGYFNAAYLRQMLADHMSGRQDYARQFGLLVTFELWNRLFIDGEPAAQ
jgi:asparagine synthase (glutamine-hydrolysing)